MAQFFTNDTVTLVNGRGQFKHKIESPKAALTADINCKIQAPVNWTGDVVIDLATMKIITDVPIPPPVTTYTISSAKSGNNVTFTIKSIPPTSTVPVALTITEYKPGATNTIIKTSEVTVTPSGGVATAIYAITQPQPSIDQKVEGKLTATPSIKTEVTVPKYVAPPPAHSPTLWVSASPSAIWMGETGTTGTINVTYTWTDMPPDFGGDLYLDLYGYDGRIKKRLALELAMSSMKRTSGSYTARLNYDLSSLLPVQPTGDVPYIRAGMYTGELVYPDGTRLNSKLEYARVSIIVP